MLVKQHMIDEEENKVKGGWHTTLYLKREKGWTELGPQNKPNCLS